MRDNEDSAPDIIESRYRAKRGQDTLNIELGLSTRQSYSSDAGASNAGSASGGGAGQAAAGLSARSSLAAAAIATAGRALSDRHSF